MWKEEHIKEQKKLYRERYRQELIEYNKKYYQEHKERLNEEKNRKIACVCGSIVSFNNYCRHKMSFKHFKVIINNE